MVTLEGGWKDAACVLVRSRIASRLALSLRRFSSRNQAMLYDQIRRMNWPQIFSSDQSLFIKSTGTTQDTDFALSYAPLRIKDAICDEFRKRGHLRPNVDRQNPDVRLNAFFYQGRCELSIDLTGQALHRRGYRQDGAEAPLRENRAAALLLFSGYDGSRPFTDPFCGSGTLAIEAALIATRTPPGILRDSASYPLVKLVPEAKAVLEKERTVAGEDSLDSPPRAIRGSDNSKPVLEVARTNARRAGVENWVSFEHADARDISAPDSWIVTNPPYGERLEDPTAAGELIRSFTHAVKHKCVGGRLGMVVPRGDLEKSVGLRPEKRLAVESGSMRLRYLCYVIQAGRFVGR